MRRASLTAGSGRIGSRAVAPGLEYAAHRRASHDAELRRPDRAAAAVRRASQANHSARSATAGATRDARSAGASAATPPLTRSTATAHASATGSVAPTP